MHRAFLHIARASALRSGRGLLAHVLRVDACHHDRLLHRVAAEGLAQFLVENDLDEGGLPLLLRFAALLQRSRQLRLRADDDALEAAGFSAEFGQVTMKAENETELTGDDAVRMQKLIDVLESLDDVQDVYTNVILEE